MENLGARTAVGRRGGKKRVRRLGTRELARLEARATAQVRQAASPAGEKKVSFQANQSEDEVTLLWSFAGLLSFRICLE